MPTKYKDGQPVWAISMGGTVPAGKYAARIIQPVDVPFHYFTEIFGIPCGNHPKGYWTVGEAHLEPRTWIEPNLPRTWAEMDRLWVPKDVKHG